MSSALNILGIEIAALDLQSAVNYAGNLIQKGCCKGYITFTGVHGIVESQFSAEIKLAHQNAILSLPDGMPLVWIGKIKGHKRMKRCYGPDFMIKMIEFSAAKGFKHFLYGGIPGVAEKLKKRMERLYFKG
ncbi:N-acetylglucosaminyldiphosphoundecaprenol N-acetyl-beta-D-mannosaminyltransferase [subsurface metagenome]